MPILDPLYLAVGWPGIAKYLSRLAKVSSQHCRPKQEASKDYSAKKEPAREGSVGSKGNAFARAGLLGAGDYFQIEKLPAFHISATNGN